MAPAYDDVFAQHPEIIEVGCWAHPRRYFKAIAGAVTRRSTWTARSPRPIQTREQGAVIEVAEGGGLYRHYERLAA